MSSRPGSKRTVKSRRGQPGREQSLRGKELSSAKRRAAGAKVTMAAAGSVVFAAAMVLARHSFAGHPKAPTTALAASPRFLSVVRQNLLNAGVVAPAQAPPGSATAAS